jgi:hypothetical protein
MKHYHNSMEKDMEEKPKFEKPMISYLKQGGILIITLIVIGGGVLTWKAPSLVRNMAKASLEESLASLGISEVEIDSVNFGWWRVYLREIHTKSSSAAANLNIQEMDVALSLFLKMKAIDVIGGTIELKEGHKFFISKDALLSKVAEIGSVFSNIKRLRLPAIGMRDCLVVVPMGQGTLKVPVHATTETTVARKQVLTVDWGEHGSNDFSGQFVVDLGRKGITVDFHTTNVDINTPSFQIKAPEISFWGTTASEETQEYKIDGFAKFDNLSFASYGGLKSPLELNFEGAGSGDDFTLDELKITSAGAGKNLLELEGNFKPKQSTAQLIMTSQVSQLSRLWDFTPLLATHEGDKVVVEGKMNITGELAWEKGHLKTSALAIEMRGVNLKRDGFALEGGSSKVVFNTMKPMTTQGLQQARANKMSVAGIDLKNVVLKGEFDNQGLLQIKQFDAETLNGTLRAHRFQRVAQAVRPTFQFEADFDKINLADILKLTDLNNLSGQGRLAGSASMSYDFEGGLDVLQAELHSISETGLIQYKPQQGTGLAIPADQKEVNMAFQVLDNLNFTLFHVRIDRMPNSESEMQGIVKMLGSNPNVLNGIVTTGKLKDLVINTLQHMRPEQDLKELSRAAKATSDAKAAKSSKSEITSKPKIAKAAKARKVSKRSKRAKGRKAMKTGKKMNRKLKDA